MGTKRGNGLISMVIKYELIQLVWAASTAGYDFVHEND